MRFRGGGVGHSVPITPPEPEGPFETEDLLESDTEDQNPAQEESQEPRSTQIPTADERADNENTKPPDDEEGNEFEEDHSDEEEDDESSEDDDLGPEDGEGDLLQIEEEQGFDEL